MKYKNVFFDLNIEQTQADPYFTLDQLYTECPRVSSKKKEHYIFVKDRRPRNAVYKESIRSLSEIIFMFKTLIVVDWGYVHVSLSKESC